MDEICSVPGITDNLEYFNEIGVDALWITPINTSPMVDFGYDVSNFTSIEPIFGTMQDFDDLMAKMKRLGRWMKVLHYFITSADLQIAKSTISLTVTLFVFVLRVQINVEIWQYPYRNTFMPCNIVVYACARSKFFKISLVNYRQHNLYHYLGCDFNIFVLENIYIQFIQHYSRCFI